MTDPDAAVKAWQSEFTFARHRVEDAYERQLDLVLDTEDRLNEVLLSPSTAPRRSSVISCISTIKLENGRWTLDLVTNKMEGEEHLGFSIQYRHQHTSREPPFWSKLSAQLCTPSGQILAEHSRDYRERARTKHKWLRWGWIAVQDVRDNEDFQIAKKLVLKLSITEQLLASHSFALPLSTLDTFDDIVERLDMCLSSDQDVSVALADGQCQAHSSVLSDECDHFDTLFTNGFQEGQIHQITRTLKRKAEDDPAESNDMSLDGQAALVEDSDMEEDACALTKGCHGFGQASSLEMRLVKLPNFSVRTFRALRMWLYTGLVNFKPLRSADNVSKLSNGILVQSSKSLAHQACSPKSLYRLADYCDLSTLKDLCFDAFMASISPSNVLVELCHDFARMHTGISKSLVAYAVEHWTEVTKSPGYKEALQAAFEHEESQKAISDILEAFANKS